MNQTVLITGADKGLGLSLVRRFLLGGCQVFAGIYQSSAKLEALVEGRPGDLNLLPMDVSSMASVQEAARQVALYTPALDILINNAGINSLETKKPLEEEDLTDGHLQKTMEVNAFGALRVTQKFLPLLEKGSRKLIINISSEAGSIANCTRLAWFAYTMSKAALNMQSKTLQNYLGPRGFKILAVHPGWMRTDMGGPEATISPVEAAEGIFQLAGRQWKAGEPVYMDYLGEAMSW